VVFLSYRANRIKDNGTMQDHYDIADFIWNHIHAKQKPTTPVPAGYYIPGAVGAELGSVSTPWTWEDYDHPDDYSRTIQRQDADHSPQTSSGDGMGHGSAEVGAPQAPQSEQDNGVAYGKIVSYEELCRHIFDKP